MLAEGRMACSSSSFGSYVSAVNKKTLPPPTTKDSSRWPQQQQLQPSPHSSSSPFTPSLCPPHSLPTQKQHSNYHGTTHNSSSNNPINTATNTSTTTGSMKGSSSSSNNSNTSTQSSDDRTYSSSTIINTTLPSSDHSDHYHRHHTTAENPSPSKGIRPFPTGTGNGGYPPDHDGGWSRGAPTKGSGWRNSKAGTYMVMMDGSSPASSLPPTSSSGLGVGGDGWGGSRESGPVRWEGSISATIEQRGAGWLSTGENEAGNGSHLTPVDASVTTDRWTSVSPGQGPPSGGGHNPWGRVMIDEASNSLAGVSSGALPSLSAGAQGDRENGVHSKENFSSLPLSWRDTRSKSPGNTMSSNRNMDKSPGESARNEDRQSLQQHMSSTDLPAGTNSSQSEEVPVDTLPPTASSSAGKALSKQEAGVVEWEELDGVSASSSERETLGGSSSNGRHAQEILRMHASSPGNLTQHHPNGSNPTSNEGQLSGCSNLLPTCKSHDGHMNSSSSDDSENFGHAQTISPRNGAGTPVQGRQNGSSTPTQSRGGAIKNDGGVEGSGGSCWRVGRLNLGSTSGGGSGSNWKGDAGRGGGNGYPSRSSSPRKPGTRYERSNSQQHPGVTHHDSTNNNDSNNNGSSGSGSHTSSSSSTPAGNSLSLGSTKNRGKVKKIISDLGEGLEVLHSEPSGWGDLPSPKETDLDNGTEYWGIPPIDLKRLKEGSRTGPPSRPSSEHHAGWTDVSPDASGGVVDWEEDSATGWGASHPGVRSLAPVTPSAGPMMGSMAYGDGRGLPPATPGSAPSVRILEQDNNGWGTTFPLKNKDKMMYTENVLRLMEMGMAKPAAEQLLKSTNNDLDMAILLSSGPEELGGTAPAVTTPAGEGSNGGCYPPMKDLPTRLSHCNKVTIPPVLGSPFDVAGCASGSGLSQEGSSLQQLKAAMTPSPSSSSQSQVQMLRWLHMQQQYLLNQIQIGNLQSGSIPPLPLNLQNYQQLLGQQLVLMQKKQQQLTQQLKLAGSGTISTHHHQTNLKLQQTQQVIAQINDQLALISHLSGSSTLQPKAPSPKSQELGFVGSSQIPVGCTPTGGGMKLGGGGGGGRSHSTSGAMVLEEGHDSKGLMFGVQGLSLGGNYNPMPSHSSSRSTSRLHQIISGSSSNSEGLIGGLGGGSQGNTPSGSSQVSSPFSPPLGVNNVPPYSNGISSGSEGLPSFGSMGMPTTTNTIPSPFLATGKSFSEIQEFKPGVLWQPRNQCQEPAGSQYLSKQNSMPGGVASGRVHDLHMQSPTHFGVVSPMLDSGLGGGGGGMGFSSRPFPGGSGVGVPHKYMRSNSTGSGFYRTGAGGGGYMNCGGGKRLSSPSTVNKYSIQYNSASGPRSDIQQGGGGLWNNMTSPDPQGIGSFGNFGHSQTRTYYPNGRPSNPSNDQSPVNLGAGSSWKQQQQQFPIHPPGSRRMAPPSSLIPRSSGGGGGLYGSSKSIGGTPIGSHNLFYSSSSSSSGSSFSSMPPVHPMEEKKWVAFPSNPNIMTPSPSMTANSVWGSNVLSSGSDEPLHLTVQRNQWGGTVGGGVRKDDRDMSRLWNQSLEMDVVTNTKPISRTRPPGLSMNNDDPLSSSAYTLTHPPTPLHGVANSADRRLCSSSVSTPSFTSGSSTWGQEEPHKEVFSPEPSFAEWQAGKKAHLSVVKLPSDVATSPWLVMRNVTNQVSSSVIKDVCSEFGVLKVCYTSHQSECALLCYSSIEEAVQAKTALDKNPTISGIPITVQFASESTIKEICEQLQLRLDSDQQQQQQTKDGKQSPWGFSTSLQANQSLLNSAALPNISYSTSSQWESHTQAPSPLYQSSLDSNGGGGSSHFSHQNSELSTPGASVWSDGGFLSGFSSSWHSSLSSARGGSAGNSLNTDNNCFPLTSLHHDTPDSSSLSTINSSTNSTSAQHFLPGGLF